MQPVLTDLGELQNRWNDTSFHISRQTEDNVRKMVSIEQRPAYLRVMHVALLALIIFSVSASACLILSGLITPLKGGGAVVSFAKLFFGGVTGVFAYDFVRLRSIVDRCRSLFREALSCLKHKKVNTQKRENWNRGVDEIKRGYKDLYLVDTAIDTFYPAVVNH